MRANGSKYWGDLIQREMGKINRFSKAYSKFDNICVYLILTNSWLCSAFSLPLHQSSAEQMSWLLLSVLLSHVTTATADQSRGRGRANAKCERSSICICTTIIWWNRGKTANTQRWGGTKSDPIPMYVQRLLMFASICPPLTQTVTFITCL